MRKKTRKNHFKGGRVYNGLPLVIRYNGYDREAGAEVNKKMMDLMNSSAGIKMFSIPSPEMSITTLKRPRITGYRRDEMTRRIAALEQRVKEMEMDALKSIQKIFDERFAFALLNILDATVSKTKDRHPVTLEPLDQE